MGRLRMHTGKPEDTNRLKKISSKSTKWRKRFYLSLGINSLLILIIFIKYIGLL